MNLPNCIIVAAIRFERCLRRFEDYESHRQYRGTQPSPAASPKATPTRRRMMLNLKQLMQSAPIVIMKARAHLNSKAAAERSSLLEGHGPNIPTKSSQADRNGGDGSRYKTRSTPIRSMPGALFAANSSGLTQKPKHY